MDYHLQQACPHEAKVSPLLSRVLSISVSDESDKDLESCLELLVFQHHTQRWYKRRDPKLRREPIS